MGKILKQFKKQNVTVKMNRQRSQYGSGWEYAVWVEISDSKDKRFGWEQDPRIFQDMSEANEHYDEIVESMKNNLKHAVFVYAPQIQNHL